MKLNKELIFFNIILIILGITVIYSIIDIFILLWYKLSHIDIIGAFLLILLTIYIMYSVTKSTFKSE